MADFELSSTLPAEYASDLERLMFFNPNQGAAQMVVVDAIEEYGTPEITCVDDSLRVTLAHYDVQALFALAIADKTAPELAGVVLYLRTSRSNVMILHIAVAERFSSLGNESGALLVLRLIHAVEACVRRLNGVEQLTILYSNRTRVMSVARDGAVHARVSGP
jgi:hypothetical protein